MTLPETGRLALRPRPRPRRRRGPRLVAAALVLGAAMLAAGHALAHARLTRSVPANEAVLAVPPASIDLWFNEILDDEFNSVELFRAEGGKPLDTHDLVAAPPRVDGEDRTHLEVPLPTLPPGAYVVHWKVLSRDGHSARGRLRFRVDDNAAAEAP